MPSTRVGRRFGLLCVWGLTSCRPEPTTYCFRTLQLDAEGHFLRLQRVPREPERGSYYTFFRGETIDMVNHYASAGDEPAKLVLLLSSDERRRLLETVRIEQIATGVYGTLSLEKDCFFGRKRGEYRDSLTVRAGMNDTRLLAPTRVTTPPASLPPLTEVSLVRIVRSAPNFVVHAATYRADGVLASVQQSTAGPGGELLSGAAALVHGAEKGQTMGLPSPEKQGLPLTLDPGNYLRTHRLVLPVLSEPEVETVLVVRYGFDAFLRVDTIKDGGESGSSLLQPYLSAEDKGLNDRCDADLRRQEDAASASIP